MKIIIILFSLLGYLVTNFIGNLTTYENVAVWISIYVLLDFLDNLGKKIVIMDLATNLACFTCLVVPVIFYHFYTKENFLANLWVKYMRVDSDVYFSYTIPAIVAMGIGFRIPLGKYEVNKNPTNYINNVKKILAQKPSLGLILVGTGVVSGLLDFLSPDSLKQVFYFMAHLTYVGAFYLIYSPNKHKRTIVPLVIVLMIGQTLVTGMFGDFLFMLACSVILILLGRKIRFYAKFLVMLGGLIFILIMQSVKFEYRSRVWGGSGADPAYYASLVVDRITNPSTILDPEKLFFVGVRMNQGWLVANTMYYVPSKYEFAHGETIWQSVAAAIVPRLLWPDKPEAGGKENLKRFWGVTIVGFSMNIGPLGEAYANYDVNGGILYMFVYGLFFNFILSYLLKLTEKTPTIVLWIPFLFFYAVGIETDLLTTMGSLLKGLFFTWLIFKVFKTAFRIEL